MIGKAVVRTTINKLNKMYIGFEKQGLYSYGENVRNRAFVFKLTQRRKKKK